jgi:hypothetical protein
VGPEAGVDGYGCPHWASNPQTVQPVENCSTDCDDSIPNPKRGPGEKKLQLLTPFQRTHRTGPSRGYRAAAVTSRRCELRRRRFSYTGCVHAAVSNMVMYGQATHCSTPSRATRVRSHRRQKRNTTSGNCVLVLWWMVSQLLSCV